MAFWTLKTEEQIRREKVAKQSRERKLEVPHGLRSAFDDQQNELDAKRKIADSFLNDIEAHFGDAVVYLNPKYTGRSKFENVEKRHDRRVGVKWISHAYSFEDCYITEISFAYTETKRGVRVDYIVKHLSGDKDVVNPDYNPDRDDVYKTVSNNDEVFRKVRRYADHQDFVNSGDHPPKWFVSELAKRKPA